MENEGRVMPIRPVPYNLSRQAAEELICAFARRRGGATAPAATTGADFMPAQSCSLEKTTPGFAGGMEPCLIGQGPQLLARDSGYGANPGCDNLPHTQTVFSSVVSPRFS